MVRSTSRAYAGTQVEVSITVLSDWGLQQFPGVFIDDIEVSTGEGTTSFEDDADPMDGWTVPGAPQDADGIEGANAQRLDPPRRPRDQGGRRDHDAGLGLPWLRLRGHHRGDDAERRDGPDRRLPPALTDPRRARPGRARRERTE